MKNIVDTVFIMISRSGKSPCHVLFSFCGICVSLILLGAITAQAATYYVATTGNDANPGTSDKPWRHPQKCVEPPSPLVAGDTCLVGDGTYTSTTSGRVVVIGSRSPAGQPGKPITIKAEHPLGAHILIPDAYGAMNCNVTGCPYRGFLVAQQYYVIEGFEITRPGPSWGTNTSITGIEFEDPGNGGSARYNYLHDIGRNVCSDGIYANNGMAVSASDITIEHNQFRTIGRRRNGEFGCSTVRFQNDHGVYARGSKNMTIRRNVFSDVNRGWPIHIWKNGGTTTTNLSIYHNTFSGRSPTGLPAGQILLGNTINGANIMNNISTDAQTGMINAYGLTASNVTVSYNLSDTLEKTGLSLAGVQFLNNIQRSTNLGFVDKPANDFRLTSVSDARNRGTKDGVPPVKDGEPDIGAYEFSEQEGDTSPLSPVKLSIQ